MASISHRNAGSRRELPILGIGKASMSVNGPVAIILAAGQGKRMKSEKAKVLHEVCGRPMIHYVVDAARGAGARTIIVVVGYAADQVLESLARRARHPLRHPVRAARDRPCRQDLPSAPGRLPGAGHGPGRRRAAPAARAAGRPAGPPGARRGRLPAGHRQGPRRRWASAASSATPRGGSCGSSRSATARPRRRPSARSTRAATSSSFPLLWEALDQIGTSNAQHEYYLTDAPERLMAMGQKVMALQRAPRRRHPRRQHPPAPRPGRQRHAGAGSRTTG